MMEYTNIITAVCTALGTLYTLKKMFFEKIDKQFEKIDKQFERIDLQFERIDHRFNKIDDHLRDIRGDIHHLDKRITRIEDRLEFSNKIVYIQHEEEIEEEE